MKYKMGSKVYITSSKKTDGRYNKGKIVGVELSYFGLGYLTETQYFNDFDHPRYKVAYVDCFTNKACCHWYSEEELQKEKPE
jgi:hypothetical protein